MFFSKSFVASALLGLASATTHSAGALAASETLAVTGAAAATGAPAAGTVNTHVIQVGGSNNTLLFSPNNVKAQPGDLVQFQFNPKNHSVVQSTFDQPCIPIQNVMPNKTDAFFSGFMPAAAAAASAGNGTSGGSAKLTYTIRVMDTKPIWFYCSQAMHCQAGMVGAINAAETGNRTMAAFIELAKSASESLSPGQASGSGNTSPAQASGGSSGGAAGTAASATGGNAAQATANAAPGRASQSFFGLGLGGLAAFMML